MSIEATQYTKSPPRGNLVILEAFRSRVCVSLRRTEGVLDDPIGQGIRVVLKRLRTSASIHANYDYTLKSRQFQRRRYVSQCVAVNMLWQNTRVLDALFRAEGRLGSRCDRFE